MEESLHGIFPIVYTPFDAAGAIDEEDVCRLVDYLIAAGTHGLAAVGGASECHKLSLAERQRLAEVVIAQAHGRVPVIVGTSATNTVDAVELTRHAEEAGAAAVFATPPLYGGAVNLEALRYHYGALARAVSLPIMAQDATVTIAPAQVARLADEFPTLSYVKEEALDSGHRIVELRALLGDRIRILSGGSYLLDDLARGAIGAIPGSVGVADLARAYDLYRQGDLRAARAAYDHFLPLSYWRRQFPLLGAKEVLRRVGVFKAAHLREPAGQRLDEHDHRELSALLEAMGPPY
ncbi:MAG TPA: dihydrodipicolinate synthase family protein [Chloroflexota bacterium]|nr:dihydrodipicolinate synthase family protein [Chloroflexota bacterium]